MRGHLQTGSNTAQIFRVYGDFWTRVFRQEGLTSAMAAAHTPLFDGGEGDERAMVRWLDEQAGDPGFGRRNIRVELSPGNVCLRGASGSELGVVGGPGVVGQPSASQVWQVALPISVSACPMISDLPHSGRILVEGADYTLSGNLLTCYVDLPEFGFNTRMRIRDGRPEWVMEMYLIGCALSDAIGYEGKWALRQTHTNARKEVFDLLVGESSLSRALAAVEAAMGVRRPTIFEREDDEGPYTNIIREVTERGMVLLPTSGGEMGMVPLSLHRSRGEEGWRLRPGDPLTIAVECFNRLSDSDLEGYCFSADGFSVVVPNSDVSVVHSPSLDLGVGGFSLDRGEFYQKLGQIEAFYGKQMEGVFPPGTANPMELLFDRQNRQQPSVLRVNAEALPFLEEAGAVFQSIADNLPAGTGVLTSFSLSADTRASFQVSDEVSVFHVSSATETINMSIDDNIHSGAAL